jgi:hypothetical protein
VTSLPWNEYPQQNQPKGVGSGDVVVEEARTVTSFNGPILHQIDLLVQDSPGIIPPLVFLDRPAWPMRRMKMVLDPPNARYVNDSSRFGMTVDSGVVPGRQGRGIPSMSMQASSRSIDGYERRAE